MTPPATHARRTSLRREVLAAAVGLLALAATVGGCGGGDEPASPGPARPSASARPSVPTSLVLVDLSGVRFDEVAPPGDAVPSPSPLPAFRALEAEGTFFAQATSPASWDRPAIAGLLTGSLPTECAMRGRPADGPSLIPAVETLAEMLADAGYATAAFTAGGRISKASRLDQGFDTWREIEDDGARLEAARAWLGSLAPDRPRLLLLHASAGAREGATRAARLAELDAWLRAARALAKGAATKDGTWFVALSDHGDPVSEREGVPGTGEAGVLDAQIRVPVVAVGRGFPPGRQDASVGLTDLVATIRDRLGLESRPSIDGRSWAPLLDGTATGGRPVRSQAWRRVTAKEGKTDLRLDAVRVPTAKFVASYDEYAGTAEEALYDLAADPGERAARDAKDLGALGAAFAAGVESIRADVRRGQAQHADPTAGPYFARPR